MRRRAGSALAAVAIALLAACQPLPHPFEDDKPPASLLKVSDTIAVSVARVVGEPNSVAAKLGHAMSEALLKRDIAASEKTTSLYSYLLYGRLYTAAARSADKRPIPATRRGQQTVVAVWRLYAPDGKLMSENKIEMPGKVAEWAGDSDGAIARLASVSADKLAPLMLDEAPKEAAVDPNSGRTRVAIGKVTGAPGDGGTALADAMSAVLKRQELAIVGNDDKPDLRLVGEVTVDPPKANKQHVKIAWHVRRADGADIGTVGQENDVPRGTLDSGWGDIAYSVALAASDGLMQVIARGAPEPGHTGSVTTAQPATAPDVAAKPPAPAAPSSNTAAPTATPTATSPPSSSSAATGQSSKQRVPKPRPSIDPI